MIQPIESEKYTCLCVYMLVSGNNGYRLWGMRIMEEFFSNGTVALSDIFPVVTMCDVDIRTMGKSVLSHNKRI